MEESMKNGDGARGWKRALILLGAAMAAGALCGCAQNGGSGQAAAPGAESSAAQGETERTGTAETGSEETAPDFPSAQEGASLAEKAASFRFEALQKIQEHGDLVYFAYRDPDNHYQLYRQTLTGADRTLLFDSEYTPIGDFAVDGGNVYVNLKYGGLWLVDGETLEKRELLEAGKATQSLSVRDGVLFLEAPNDEGDFYDRYFYPIREDGGLGEPLVEENAYPAMPYGEDGMGWILETPDFAVASHVGSRDETAYYVTWEGEGRKDRQETPVCEGFQSVLGYDETSLYVGSVREPEGETPVTGDFLVGRFDRQTLQYEELLRIPCRMGLGGSYRSGPFAAAVLEDEIYALYPAEDGMSDHLAVFEKGGDGEPDFKGDAISADPLGDLGEVKIEGKNLFCPVCGNRDWYFDQELTLAEAFPGDAAINETLRGLYADHAAWAEDYVKASASWDGGCIHEFSAVSICSESEMRVLYDGGRYLNLMRVNYDYGGGAHGNSARDSMLFDRQPGSRLKLSDVLDHSEEEIRTMVADAFCDPPYYNEDEIWKERRQAVYDAAGPDMAFGLSEEGVTFYFGQYEVASYAEGFPAVTIPFDRLKLKIDLNYRES